MSDKPITPTSVSTRPITDADRASLAEQEAIRLGVADITFAWASIENALFYVLFHILRTVNIGIASAIYFTPASIETRQRIVDNALRQLINGRHPATELLSEWDKALTALNRMRKTRNRVAHGEMVMTTSVKGVSSARLVGPMLKLDQYDAAFIEAYFRGQKPGMGSNELRTATRAANGMALAH